VMWGPITKAVNQTIKDLSGREIAVMAPLIALMLLMGLYPRPLLSRMEPSLNLLLDRVGSAQARMETAHARTIAVLAVPAARNLAEK
jgi:NADH-quinone oxidoreductase subunit M